MINRAVAAVPLPSRAITAEALEARRLLAVDFVIDDFVDPGSSYTEYYDGITRVLNAAGDDWGGRFDSNVTIDVEIRFEFNTADNYIAKSGVFDSEPVRTVNGVSVVEIGPAHEIRTGDDINASVPDAFITFNAFQIEKLFFDPVPATRVAPIPDGKVDAYTVILRELGHVIGFSSYKNRFTGEVIDNTMTTFDEKVAFPTPDSVVFTGETAQAENGGEFVPLRFGDISHYGNPGGPGEDLAELLMGGIDVRPDERRYISDIDLAILLDLGLPAMYEGDTIPNPPVPPVLDIGGTPRHDLIEVTYTGNAFLLNVTNKQQTGNIFDPFLGQFVPRFEQVTTRYTFPSEGFTELVIRGQRGADRIIVNADMISCTIVGGDGDDTIIGGNGNDTIFGNAGNDHISGGNGDDRLDGGGGQDLLIGGFGNDRLFGNTGNDTLDGSIGDDRLWGGDGVDSIYGGRGNDRLFGEADDDFLSGDEGKDTMDGGTGADRMEGGPGLDTADYINRTADIVVTLDEMPGDGEAGENDNVTFNTEIVWGGLGNDRLVGTGANNVFFGNFGNDSIDGGTGDDYIEGFEGDDVLDGQIGRDTIFAGAGNDRVNGGPDADLIFGGVGNDRLYSIDRSADTVNGGAGVDVLTADERDLLEDAGL